MEVSTRNTFVVVSRRSARDASENWGWAAAQYPYIHPPGVTIAGAAAHRTTLITLLVSLLIGSVLLIPALLYLYTLFQRSHHRTAAGVGAAGPDGGPAH